MSLKEEIEKRVGRVGVTCPLVTEIGTAFTTNFAIGVLINEKLQVINIVLSGGEINDSCRTYSCDKIRSFLHCHGFPTRLISK